MTKNSVAESPLLTVAEVAAKLRVTPETVRRWIRAGALPAIEIGGRRAGLRVEAAQVEAYVEQRRLRLGERGQPLDVTVPQILAGDWQRHAPRTTIALLEERALFQHVAPWAEGSPRMCLLCGGTTERLPVRRQRYTSWVYRCTNRACGDVFQDIITERTVCGCGDEPTMVGPALRVKRAPRSGLALQIWGTTVCAICDVLGLYHWTKTPEGRQITFIRWAGYTRHAITFDADDATKLQINRSVRLPLALPD